MLETTTEALGLFEHLLSCEVKEEADGSRDYDVGEVSQLKRVYTAVIIHVLSCTFRVATKT